MSSPVRNLEIACKYVLVQTINKQKYYYDHRGGWTLEVVQAKRWADYPDSTTLQCVNFYGCCAPVVIEEVAN